MKKQTDTRRVPADDVLGFLQRVFAAVGVDDESAQQTASGLWSASLRGVDSHGLRLTGHYVRVVQAGRVNPRPVFQFEQTSASTGRLDADHAFGMAAGMRAVRHAIDLARQSGSGQVSVYNSTHCGAMAHFALEAARADMIGTAFTHGTPKMRTAGATSVFLGTNPICLAAPMADEEPFCYDGSTTTFSGNKVRVFGERGQELPPQCGADADGKETRVPSEVEQLLPIGDYKGFGLALCVELLSGLLAGMPAGDEVTDMFTPPLSTKRFLGHFFTAQRIDTFIEPSVFKKRLQELAVRIRSQPRLDASIPVQIAGDPEKTAQADRLAHGIPIAAAEFAELAEIAAEFRVEPLVAGQSLSS